MITVLMIRLMLLNYLDHLVTLKIVRVIVFTEKSCYHTCDNHCYRSDLVFM